MAAERALEQNAELLRHLGIRRIRSFRVGGIGVYSIGCCGGTDEEPEAEWLAAELVLQTHQLGAREGVREPLRLLQRQHPQRKPAPRGDAELAPSYPVEETCEHDHAQVGLGLAAAGGEPQRVDELPPLGARVNQALEHGEDVPHLERSPAVIPVPCRGMAHRLVHQAERPQRVTVAAKARDAGPDAPNLIGILIALGACCLEHLLG